MAIENIELVDRDYEKCSKEAMPRQIKTRKTSFSNIVEKFRNFRIRRLERKMEKTVDKILSKDYKKKNISDKLMSKSMKLAKLEEKIRVLSREEVPSRFVKSRAIKLRNYMMENTVRSADGLYYVDLDDYDVLNFVANGEDKVNNPVNISTVDAPDEVSNDNSIDLSSETIDRDSLIDSINSGFSNLENADELDEDVIDKDSISSVVENSLDDIKDDNTIDGVVTPSVSVDNEKDDETVIDVVDSSKSEDIDVVVPEIDTINYDGNNTILTDIDKESIKKSLNDALSDLEKDDTNEQKEDTTTFVSPEEVNMVVGNNTNEDITDDAVKDDKISDFVDDTSEKNVDPRNIKEIMDSDYKRIFKREASAVRSDKYDENGDIRFKYMYTPMTDSEIEEAREKINSLVDFKPKKFETDSISNIFTPIDTSASIESSDVERDVPIIVDSHSDENDENDKIAEYAFDIDESSMDYSPADKENNVVTDVSDGVQSKISEYNMLKERILKLREKRSSVDKDRMEAQTSAKQTALKAQATKEKVAKSAAVLDDKVEQMRIYCEGLEKDCDETIKETNELQDDIRNNTSFIEAQEDQLDKNTRMIDEIDRLIGDDEESHFIRK